MLKPLIKSLVFPVFANSGAPRLLHRRFFPQKLTIVTYHAVVRSPLPIYDWCFLDENSFRNQMLYLKKHFNVLPLTSAVEALKLGNINRPTAVITFDDGYQNNYSIAFPILRELGASRDDFSHYGWIDTGDTLRYLRLNLALANTPRTILPWNGRTLDLRDMGLREQANVLIRQEIRSLPEAERSPRLRNVIIQLGDDPERPMDLDSPFRMLSSNAVKDMAESGVIEFGAHTHSHPVLSRLSKEECRQEIESSVENVEKLTGRPCTVFAYPFGGRQDYTQQTVDVLRACGIRAAVTTVPGFNDKNSSPLELRRYSAGPNEDMSVFQLKVHHLRTWGSKVNDH